VAHRNGVPNPMIKHPQMENLRQFFAGYFHEDWSAEATTPEHILSMFIDQRGASSELQELGQCIVAFYANHQFVRPEKG
jgi:hypothetical protein